MQAKSKNILFYTLIIVGLVAASFLLYEHYTPTPSKFCNFGNNFDCGIVNKSPYATIDGIFYLLAVDFKLPISIYNIPIPVAGMGMIILFLLAYLMHGVHYQKKVLGLTPQSALKVIKLLLIMSLVFSLYLFLIEIFLLKTYCIFCIILDIILITLTIIACTIKVRGEGL
ncbi:hypothetical protein HYY69_04035 [Candidatus Woesearchaeota archaeon]|nr:hypothetical protein [Candidatus Woesearchaeota archaeon]